MRVARNFVNAGLDRWQLIADTLNKINDEPEGISINDQRIWSGILHTWTNEDWALVLHSVELLMEQHPEFFKSYHEDAFISARDILTKHYQTHDRVLDKKPYKRYAWKMLMALREVWNAARREYAV